MKLLFINRELSGLSDNNIDLLNLIKEFLLSNTGIKEVFDPEEADAIIIQEKESFKNFRYIKELLSDPIICNNLKKIYTINRDDCATGLLRGIYTSIPKSRFDTRIHVAVPYHQYPNELVFEGGRTEAHSFYLGGWRGNTKSNKLRTRMFQLLQSNRHFFVEKTDSWFNHPKDEKQAYIDVILNSKFSLCPLGWAPVSYRIYESMALGRCPVIIADEFVPPIGPNWNDFALFLPQNKMEDLPFFLVRHQHIANQFGKKAYEAWQEYFCRDRVIQFYAESLVLLIKSTPKTSKEAEISRWRSLGLHWSNKWTLPQRFVNRVFF